MTWGSVMHSSLEEKCASGSCVCGPAGSCVVEEAVPRYLTQHEGMILVDICSVLILSGAHLSANARSVHAWSETTHAGNMALCSTAW